ncbi:hypothetical protein, partial [Nitrospirillum viridazoti]
DTLASMGRFDEAMDWYRHAAETAEHGDPAGLAATLTAGAACLRKLGRTEEAGAWELRARAPVG